MEVNLKIKEIKANKEYRNIIVDEFGCGSVAFLADLPKDAIVTGVKVKGKYLDDHLLDPDYGHLMRLSYHREKEFEGHRVAAVFTCENCGGEVYEAAALHDIDSFVVEFVEVAVSRV